jgi:chemotaxis protein MotB
MPRPRRRRFEADSGHAWILTYADLMSLLLTFFILLAAFSTVNDRKVHQAISSIQDALGVQPMVPITPAVPGNPAPEKLQHVARELQRRLQILGKTDALQVKFEQDGLRMVLPETISFDTARADLKPESEPVLSNIGEIIGQIAPDCAVEVRGHTDSRPLSGSLRFRDNYDLSYARADVVARRIAQAGSIPMERFKITACGPGEPVAPNQTPEGQQANRRVEIFIRGEDSSRMQQLQEVKGNGKEAAGSQSEAPADRGNQ